MKRLLPIALLLLAPSVGAGEDASGSLDEQTVASALFGEAAGRALRSSGILQTSSDTPFVCTKDELLPALTAAPEDGKEALLSMIGGKLSGGASSAAAPQPNAAVAAAGKADDAHDKDFLEIRKAFAADDAAKVERLAAKFPRSLLEPYVAFYRLDVKLETANVADIRQFLARPEDTPLIDRLRGEWLKQVGEDQQWDVFLEEYPHLVNADDELTCYALQARRSGQWIEALTEARRLWFGSDEPPENCTPLFDAAIAAGAISEEDVLQRIRLALEAGKVSLAGKLAAKLPPQHAPSATALTKARSHPARYLASVKLAQASAAERMVALFALQRLAKQSPPLAYAQWEKIAAHFPEAEQRYFYGWLGYEASRSQDERALQWYRQAGNTPLSVPQYAWRVRAALRMQDWGEVLASINAMGEEQQRENAWRYWKARALKELGKREDARVLFAALIGDYGYYGQLAADELDLPLVSETPADNRVAQADIDAVLAHPGIRRALALYRMELNGEASREWAWAVRRFDDRQLLAAAEVARRNGIYERAIDTAERTQQLHDFNLRFPAPFRDELQQHVRENHLDEAWVYGLMRQESRFATRARSGAGAAGLMQLMPATARWAAKRLGLKGYRKGLIHELDTNLKLGTYYLKTVLVQFDNNPVLASAGYNAGPIRAQQWRGETPLEGAIYIETIPFDETRNYVKKVMSNTVYYSRLFGQPIASLKQRLGVIGPRAKPERLALADVP